MRVRRSLLMGLGIMIALSVGAPVAATEIDPDQVVSTDEIGRASCRERV